MDFLENLTKLLDDKNLYYMFFDNLRELSKQNVDGKVTDGSIINQAIKATIQQYAGGNGVNKALRWKLTELTGENVCAIYFQAAWKKLFLLH